MSVHHLKPRVVLLGMKRDEYTAELDPFDVHMMQSHTRHETLRTLHALRIDALVIRGAPPLDAALLTPLPPHTRIIATTSTPIDADYLASHGTLSTAPEDQADAVVQLVLYLVNKHEHVKHEDFKHEDFKHEDGLEACESLGQLDEETPERRQKIGEESWRNVEKQGGDRGHAHGLGRECKQGTCWNTRKTYGSNDVTPDNTPGKRDGARANPLGRGDAAPGNPDSALGNPLGRSDITPNTLRNKDPANTHDGSSKPGVEAGIKGRLPTVGIIGMGHAGRRVARQAGEAGLRVRYWNHRRLGIDDEAALGARWCGSVGEVVDQADVVVL